MLFPTVEVKAKNVSIKWSPHNFSLHIFKLKPINFEILSQHRKIFGIFSAKLNDERPYHRQSRRQRQRHGQRNKVVELIRKKNEKKEERNQTGSK